MGVQRPSVSGAHIWLGVPRLPSNRLDGCADFLELFFKKGAILSMTPVEMHLKSFGGKLEFVTEPFRSSHY